MRLDDAFRAFIVNEDGLWTVTVPLIRFTYAIADPTLPSTSLNINVKLPLPVKVYVLLPPLLVIVRASEYPVSVAVTGHAVGFVVLYITLAVGFSIWDTRHV